MLSKINIFPNHMRIRQCFMQSEISVRGLLPQNSVWKVLPIVFDILLILDIFLSTYIFFFNPDRTPGYGLWLVFGLQTIFLPILILIAHLQSKKLNIQQTNRLEDDPSVVNKHPLAYTLPTSNQETEIVQVHNGARLGFLKTLIYFSLAMNVVISVNFMLLGIYINSRGGDSDPAINNLLFDQVFYLPPIFLLIYLYTHFADQYEGKIEIIKGAPNKFNIPKTFISKVKIRKGLRIFVLISFILLLLFVGIFAYTKQTEDNNLDIIKLNETGAYENQQIYGIYENGDKIEVIAYGLLTERFIRSHHILKYTIDIKSNTITNIDELPNLPIGFVRVIDSIVTESEIYFLLLDNQEWNYLVFKYTFETDVFENIYTWDLEMTGLYLGFVYQATYDQWAYMLSPYENGVHLIQTRYSFGFDPPQANVKSISDDGSVTETSLNLNALDVVTYDDKTYLLHISDSSIDNFDLTVYNDEGESFTDAISATLSLPSRYSENIYDYPTPNSATLFISSGTLYYRSTQNLFDINNMQSSNSQPNINSESSNFEVRGLRGVVNVNDILLLNTADRIQYVTPNDLTEVEVAIALNSRYSGSLFSNALHFSDKLITASDDGRIYTWDIDPKLVQQDKDRHTQLIKFGIVVYLVSVSIYFAIRRKV